MANIEEIERAIQRFEFRKKTGIDDKCQYYENIALEALEKQMPKKPSYEYGKNIYGAIKRTCANCGDVCLISEQAKDYEHYCRFCGQKLIHLTDINVGNITPTT